jgi:uncharacterized membrane protein YtjA (UPF0391 family)
MEEESFIMKFGWSGLKYPTPRHIKFIVDAINAALASTGIASSLTGYPKVALFFICSAFVLKAVSNLCSDDGR